jgi:diguanylate cyclase (GGDEF)-like protein
MVTALMLLSLGMSMLSISRLNQDFEQYQTNTMRQGTVQFELQSRILRQQIRIWLESFTDIVQLKNQSDFQVLTKAFENQFDALQINHNVENLWLVSEEIKPLYISAALPEYVKPSIKRVIKSNSPDYFLHCQKRCEQYVTIPMLNNNGDMAIVTMAISFVDVIYAINQTLENEIAIIGFDKAENIRLNDAEIISASAPNLVKGIFHDKNNDVRLENVIDEGLQASYQNQSHLVNLMSLASSPTQDFYLAQIDDVSSFAIKSREYKWYFLMSALAIFFVIALLLHFVTRPFTKKLLVLSDVLPLLAQKEFDKFRSVKIAKSKAFPDELDILSNSAIELSYELEKLNLEVSQKTKALEHIAMYDPLTGLANRNMLNLKLKQQFSTAGNTLNKIALIFLDLDDFKKVNDSNGHGEGDKLLVEAANRLSTSVRDVDTICRFGGDEFVILLGPIDSPSCAEKVANTILNSFKVPIKIASSLFYVTCSIGIAINNDEKIKADELISRADIAMYEAKTNGGDQLFVYQGDMYQRVAHRVMMEGEVKQALAKQQFSLSLQPQLYARSHKVHGFEALLRWHHPERGMVSPDDFIPILENSEHMIELGYWVIRRCFELFQGMKDLGLSDITIAINFSAAQFADINLYNYLKDLLVEFDHDARNFELELTEQTLVKDIDKAIETMDALRRLGFSFAIDDFGTGYSSLAYLKRMPVDVIKIDKSFVFGMLDNHADFQIIMSTIAMVKNLGLTVIAEGVETQAQLHSLTDNDCDLIQGYYFSKPIAENELFAFIGQQIVDGNWRHNGNSSQLII